MRWFLTLSCLALTACASTPDTSTSKPAATEVAKLASGDCGLFGWTADNRRTYVFFASETEASLALDGPAEPLTPQTAFPAVRYADASGNPVTLQLGRSEEMVGGLRYPSASLTVKTDAGWDKIVPVAIVESCQP